MESEAVCVAMQGLCGNRGNHSSTGNWKNAQQARVQPLGVKWHARQTEIVIIYSKAPTSRQMWISCVFTICGMKSAVNISGFLMLVLVSKRVYILLRPFYLRVCLGIPQASGVCRTVQTNQKSKSIDDGLMIPESGKNT